MSLAQDSNLDRAQMRLLNGHIEACPQCRQTWEAMNEVSRLLHAAPLAEPSPGFVQRFEARLAYHLEQRRRVMVWLLMGIGAIALALLALPSLVGVLSLTGRLLLPDATIAYLNGLLDWTYLVVTALFEAAGVLIRYVCTGPTAPLCLAIGAVAASLVALWTKFLVGRLSRQRA
jgi:hypothetical protein